MARSVGVFTSGVTRFLRLSCGDIRSTPIVHAHSPVTRSAGCKGGDCIAIIVDEFRRMYIRQLS